MNKSRRKVLNGVLDTLETLMTPISKDEAIKILQNSQEKVEECADDEEDALDNRPESFMWSTVNDEMSDNISDLRDACCDFDIVIEQCENSELYDYKLIQDDLKGVINNISKAINR